MSQQSVPYMSSGNQKSSVADGGQLDSRVRRTGSDDVDANHRRDLIPRSVAGRVD